MTTLLDLKTRARQRADMVDSEFISDAELTSIINQGAMELYDLIVNAYEDYFTVSQTYTIANGTNTLTLPATFYKLRALDFSVNGVWVACRQFNFNDRNRTQHDTNWFTGYGPLRSYRVMKDSLILQPTQSAGGDYQLWYIPSFTALASNSDVLPASMSKFGWDEYIVLFAVSRMLSKEESSTTDVDNDKAQLSDRIIKMASDRQVDQSDTIQDVQRLWREDKLWYDY